MGNAYMAIPIAITVEGANTLTRSLIIFGQGLTRSHPHLLDIIRSIQHGDDQTVCISSTTTSGGIFSFPVFDKRGVGRGWRGWVPARHERRPRRSILQVAADQR